MARTRTILPPKPGKEQLLIKSGRNKASNTPTIKEATAGMQRGEVRTGFLGEGNLLHKPDFIPGPENLGPDGVARKRVTQDLLAKWIIPNSLSAKSTPELDRKSMVNKLRKSTLAELQRLLPESVNELTTEQLKQIFAGESDIGDEQKAEIQDLYLNVSP